MPMDLLYRLSHASMPAQVVEPGAIYKLHVLRSAGHVFASIPALHYTSDGQWHQAPATVYQVTALGHKVLRYFGPDDRGDHYEKDHSPLPEAPVPPLHKAM